MKGNSLVGHTPVPVTDEGAHTYGPDKTAVGGSWENLRFQLHVPAGG